VNRLSDGGTEASTDPALCALTRDPTRAGRRPAERGSGTCFQGYGLIDTPGRRNRRPTFSARRDGEESWAPLRGTPGVNGFEKRGQRVNV
jgi:hypothetical protein